MSNKSWSLFIGPYSSEDLSKKNIAAVRWFSLVYRSYQEHEKGVISIAYDSYWPKGDFIPRYEKNESLFYINVYGIRTFTKVISLTILFVRLSLAFGKPHKVYFYNLSREILIFSRILFLFSVKDSRLFLLDFNLDKHGILKLTRLVRKFSCVYVGSYWLQTELSHRGINSKLFSGGIDGGISRRDPEHNVIVYSGKYDKYGGVDDIIPSLIESKIGEFTWIFTGNCTNQRLITLSKARHDVQITGILTDVDLNKVIGRASYCLVPGDASSVSWHTVFPSKVWTYGRARGTVISAPYPGYSPELISSIIVLENFREDLLEKLRSLRQRDSVGCQIDHATYSIDRQIEVIYG